MLTFIFNSTLTGSIFIMTVDVTGALDSHYSQLCYILIFPFALSEKEYLKLLLHDKKRYTTFCKLSSTASILRVIYTLCVS